MNVPAASATNDDALLSPCKKSIALGVALLALVVPAAAAACSVDNVALQCLERRSAVCSSILISLSALKYDTSHHATFCWVWRLSLQSQSHLLMSNMTSKEIQPRRPTAARSVWRQYFSAFSACILWDHVACLLIAKLLLSTPSNITHSCGSNCEIFEHKPRDYSKRQNFSCHTLAIYILYYVKKGKHSNYAVNISTFIRTSSDPAYNTLPGERQQPQTMSTNRSHFKPRFFQVCKNNIKATIVNNVVPGAFITSCYKRHRQLYQYNRSKTCSYRINQHFHQQTV